MSWKDFFYFQRSSQRAVILLLILIVLTLILNTLLRYRNSSEVVLVRNDSLVREFEAFKQALEEPEIPSTADAGTSDDGERLRSAAPGAENRVASWPERHGFSDGNTPPRTDRSLPRSEAEPSSRAAYPATGKLSAGETIFLNATDTAEWKKIPGIGSVYASRIVNYRALLGGFVEVGQLREVYGIDPALFSRIAVYIEPDANYRRIAVNQLEFKELLRHPYLNYKQVQAIMSIRRRKGAVSSIRELSILDEFTSEDIFRLEAYLAF